MRAPVRSLATGLLQQVELFDEANLQMSGAVTGVMSNLPSVAAILPEACV
jgi:hypothetical protein